MEPTFTFPTNVLNCLNQETINRQIYYRIVCFCIVCLFACLLVFRKYNIKKQNTFFHTPTHSLHTLIIHKHSLILSFSPSPVFSLLLPPFFLLSRPWSLIPLLSLAIALSCSRSLWLPRHRFLPFPHFFSLFLLFSLVIDLSCSRSLLLPRPRSLPFPLFLFLSPLISNSCSLSLALSYSRCLSIPILFPLSLPPVCPLSSLISHSLALSRYSSVLFSFSITPSPSLFLTFPPFSLARSWSLTLLLSISLALSCSRSLSRSRPRCLHSFFSLSSLISHPFALSLYLASSVLFSFSITPSLSLYTSLSLSLTHTRTHNLSISAFHGH